MAKKIQHPKIVILGAGSLFFGRQAIWQMVHSPYLNHGTLALVDTDAERMAKMGRLAEMVIADQKVPLKLEFSINRKNVLEEADFVVLSFAKQTVKYRGMDCQVSKKYGVRMCSGDTIGPGGVFRAMREFPVILEVIEDVRKFCPTAWVINYINPTAVHGIGLFRYAPDIKSFALCDGLHLPYVKQRYALDAGIISSTAEYTDELDRNFDLRIAGVNHFTFILKAEYKGQDVLPAIAATIRRAALQENSDSDAKAVFNAKITDTLYQIFGVLPACTAHTKEYLPYWQGKGVLKDIIPPLKIWETEPRYQAHAEMFKQVDDFISGRIPISNFMMTFGPDHATDIIESMVGNLGKPFYINTPNRGAVTNMHDDAFLELCSDISLEGIQPRPVGEMPRGIRGYQELVLDTHELTAEAIYKCDKNLLRRAILTDPIVNSIADGDAILEELLIQERDALPDGWF